MWITQTSTRASSHVDVSDYLVILQLFSKSWIHHLVSRIFDRKEIDPKEKELYMYPYKQTLFENRFICDSHENQKNWHARKSHKSSYLPILAKSIRAFGS
jgi:hypothetical protein